MMTSKPWIVGGLALPLIAASDGGPPSTGNFYITVVVILACFFVLRTILPGLSKLGEGRPARSADLLSATPDKPLSAQTAAELAARLDRIRLQAVGAPSRVSEAAPPTTFTPVPPERAAIPPQNDAILFQQHFPPRADALSYWGGVPLVPPGFTWPVSTAGEGAGRALHHVVQLDCAAIPDAARLGLPEDGLLHMFVALDWGGEWGCHVSHSPGDPTQFALADVPDTLPNTYGRAMHRWVRRDEDWPHLLPRWSFDPLLVRGGHRPPSVDEDEEEERRFWPGTIDLETELAKADGAIAPLLYFDNSYCDDRRLVRPYANFPHDWQAVRIAIGELAYQAKRGHMDRFAARGDMTLEEVDAFKAGLQSAIAEWTMRADSADTVTPLTTDESDSVWQIFLDYQHVSLFALSKAVNQSIEATLSANADATNILPDGALALVRSRHALGSRGERGLHLNTPDHLLGPPSYVQGAADERLHEWLLLFEMSSNDPIGHLFAEGVYQFWIRPEDLAARRFDRVELEGSAY